MVGDERIGPYRVSYYDIKDPISAQDDRKFDIETEKKQDAIKNPKDQIMKEYYFLFAAP